MAPSRSRQSAVDSDTSMAEASEPVHQLEVDPMVSLRYNSSRGPPWASVYI